MSNIQILDQNANLVSVASDKAPSTRRNKVNCNELLQKGYITGCYE